MPSIAPIRKKTLSDSVKDSLRKLISEKAFNEAGKLPPEEELARQLAVSRITIRKALTDLEQEGLLLRIHGRGTFVNPAARQVKVNLSGMLEFGSVISGNGYRPECRLFSVDEERIPASVGEHLGTGKGGRGYTGGEAVSGRRYSGHCQCRAYSPPSVFRNTCPDGLAGKV